MGVQMSIDMAWNVYCALMEKKPYIKAAWNAFMLYYTLSFIVLTRFSMTNDVSNLVK